MDIQYYPGCTMKTSAVNSEVSAKAVAEVLGINLIEMEDWNCCGVVSSLASDLLMHQIAPLRNLIHVQDAGSDKVTTLCDMCANTLKQTNLFLKENPDSKEALTSFMDKEDEYKQEVKVLHFLELLRDEIGFDIIKKKVKKPLKGLKVMPYYGCMLLRPAEVAIDDPEEPTVLRDLMKSLGAEVVDSPYKIECCGSYHTVDHKEIVARRVAKITSFATERGVDAIVLSCPLCKFNLDKRGEDAVKMFEGFERIPVLYFSQLMAVAFGLPEEILGFDQHSVAPRPVLEEKGIL